MSATTGSDGRFSFNGVPAGRYRVVTSRAGFVEGSAASARAIVLSDAPVRNLRMSLTPTGAVSGRVFDNTGDPLANITVQALRYAWEDGQRTLNEVKSTQTNDRGEFRLFWLPPGRYYLRAMPDNERFAIRMHTNGVMLTGFADSSGKIVGRETQHFAAVYYPGTADPQAASAVDVASGSDVGGVDFVLVKAATRNVRASVIDGVTGQPVRNPTLALVGRSGSGSGNAIFLPTADQSVLEARGVLPGSYYVMANARIDAGNNSFWVRAGRARVDVAENDVDNVVVVVQPTVDVPGRVIIEGGVLTEQTHPIVTLRNALSGAPARSTMYANFSDSRQFVIDSVVESEYRVVLSDLPRGTYLKSVRYGGTEAMDGVVHIDPRTQGALEVVLGANGGALDGVVSMVAPNGIGRESLIGASVALVPIGSSRDREDLFRGARTNELGRFRMEGIAPGDYLLFAWEDIDEALWRDPEFVRRNEGLGRPIRINENGQETAELTALPIQ